MKIWKNLLPITFGALLLQACNDASVIGSDLLEQDQINVAFTDTTTLIAYSIQGDSALTYDPENPILTSLFGQFEDPIFGVANSTINTQFSLSSQKPNLENVTVDSVVITLPYSEANLYGNYLSAFNMEVYSIDDPNFVDTDAKYYSNQVVEVGSLLATHSFQAMPLDSVDVDVYGSDTGESNREYPQVRIRIPENSNFVGKFLDNPDIYESDSLFLETFQGLQLRATTKTPGMLSFDLASGLAGILIYYRQDTNYLQYKFPINANYVTQANFVHDFTDGVIAPFLNNPALGDSLIFIQGMAGANAVIELPYVENYQNMLINRAELELTIKYLDEDESTYPPVSQIIISEILEDGSLSVIDDVVFALQRSELDNIFGGVPVEDDPSKYRLNISAHFKNMRDGLASHRLQISALTRSQQASRVVICGPGHSEHPAKLNLSFTPF
ncbi:MAG: DUF4270 family protein [Phaeodactylibacter sp.]|nr:DUF4270 family protein [Phaeodactylibacter sp.]